MNAVLEWYQLYKEDLLNDWNLAISHNELNKIPPLE